MKLMVLSLMMLVAGLVAVVFDYFSHGDTIYAIILLMGAVAMGMWSLIVQDSE